jgi:hypothetical protein
MAVQKVKSWAGTNEYYVGNNCFRIRKLGSDRVRLHLRRDIVRVRDEYIAVDPKVEDLIAAFKELDLLPKEVAKPYKDPFEDC